MSMNSIYVGIRFVLGLFSVKIISVYLGPSGMTIISHFRDFLNMFKTISSLGVNNSVITSIKNKEVKKDELSKVLSSFFWFYIVLSLLLGLLIALLSKQINWVLFENYDYYLIIAIAGLLLPFYFIYVFIKAILNGIEKFKEIIIAEIIAVVFVFSLSFYLIYSQGLIGGLYAVAITEFFIFSCLMFFFVRYAKKIGISIYFTIKKKHLKILKKFGVIAIISAMIVPATMMLIRDNIIEELGEIQAGIWDATKRLSNFYLMFITSGLSLYYVPKIASINDDFVLRKEVKSYFISFMPFTIIGFVLIYLLRDFLIQFALTDDFYQVKDLMIWQFLGDTLKIATLCFGYILSVRAMILQFFIVELAFHLLFYFFSQILISGYGIEGVVIAYALASIISFLVILSFFRKIIFPTSFNCRII